MIEDEKEHCPFEEEWSKLTDFLYGRRLRNDEVPDDRRMSAYHRALLMLSAAKLFDACEFALATLQGLSTEDFAAGGDAIARDRLAQALRDATYGSWFGTERRHQECRDAVTASIRRNRARTL
jgi:hypothetical protein